MKIFLLSFLMLLSPLLFPQRMWFEQNPYPTTNLILGFQFLSHDLGFAYGEYGELLKTSNAGETWDDISFNSIKYFIRDCSFTDMNNGAIIDQNLLLAKTTDGGNSWVQQTGTGYGYSMTDVGYADQDTGFLVVVNGTLDCFLFKTTDRGSNWSIVPLNNTHPVSVKFFNSREGLLVGNKYYQGGGIIYRTTDGGLTWIEKTSSMGTLPNLWDIYFVNENIAFATGPGNSFKTTNGGETWNILTANITSPTFSDSLNGFCISPLRKTTDGGLTWNSVSTGSTRTPYAVQMIDNNNIFLSCEGAILKSSDGGTNWSWYTRGFTDNLNAIHVITDAKAVAVGAGGIIAETFDGGKKWYKMSSPTNELLRDVHFSDLYNGFAVGNAGVIIHTTDGGISWTLQNSGTTASLKKVHIFDMNNAVILGDDLSLLTSDRGQTWSSHSIAVSWNDVYFFDRQNWIAVGNSGYFGKTTDGGSTWNAFQIGYNYDFLSISFRNNKDGLAIGGNFVFRSTDAGLTWQLSHSCSEYVNNIKYKNNKIIVVGPKGAIYRSSNNGARWDSDIFSAKDLKGIGISDEEKIYIVGDGGIILTNKDVLTSIQNEDGEDPATNYNLLQNYPNPFNPSTTIKYSLLSEGKVKITVFDILGREVKVLVDEEKSAGIYTVDFAGSDLSSGVYFYQMKTKDYIQTNKMILLK